MGLLSKRFVLAAALVTAVILFVWGVLSLAVVRFEQGDSFAPYSSFRADPLGSRGLYGSLDKLTGVETRRHLRPLSKLDGAEDQTVMLLGLPARVLEYGDKNLEKQLLRLAEEGSRVLIAVKPPTDSFLKSLQKQQEEDAQAEKNKTDSDEAVTESMSEEAVEEDQPDWGLAFSWQLVHEEMSQLYSATRSKNEQSLPTFLDVHTPLLMTAEDDAWQTIYNYGAQMVVAERAWGEGSLVVFVDAYPFSNESLRTQAEAEILSWALGDARDVVFTESHLGVNESPGIMILIQRYRMDGILLVLFLIAVLVVWKNTIPLVPPPAAVEGGIATRDHFSGLVNLLKRHVTTADLPEACHREWRRSLPKHGFPGDEKRNQIKQQVQTEMKRPAKERRPLNLYRRICKLLSERNI